MGRLHPPPPYTRAELAAMFPEGRRPPRPCVIPPLPEAPRIHPTLSHLADDVARILGQRVPIIRRITATYLGYDTFPAFNIEAFNPAGGPTARKDWICAVAVQETPIEDLWTAIEAAQVRQMGAAA